MATTQSLPGSCQWKKGRDEEEGQQWKKKPDFKQEKVSGWVDVYSLLHSLTNISFCPRLASNSMWVYSVALFGAILTVLYVGESADAIVQNKAVECHANIIDL